jgi:hypothetical protein
MKKPISEIGKSIAAGRARIAELVNKAAVVNGKQTGGVIFVSDFKKLTNPWVAFVEKLQDLKVGEAMALDTDKPPTGLIRAAALIEIDLEYGRTKEGKLLVRAHASKLDEELA